METKTESKTILEFLLELPEDIREMALRNYNPQYADTDPMFKRELDRNVCWAVCYAFDWDKSREGCRFWGAVSDGFYAEARAILKQSPPSPDLREQLTDDDGFDTVAWIKSTGRDPMSVSIEAYRLLGELAKQHKEQLTDEGQRVYKADVDHMKAEYRRDYELLLKEFNIQTTQLDEAVRLLKNAREFVHVGGEECDLGLLIDEFLSKHK